MAEIKRIAELMRIKSVVFPDTSGVLNGPITGIYEMYPRGGTTIRELTSTGGSQSTIALGPIASGPAAKQLDVKSKCPVKYCNCQSASALPTSISMRFG